jgi:hypothetical protein
LNVVSIENKNQDNSLEKNKKKDKKVEKNVVSEGINILKLFEID